MTRRVKAREREVGAGRSVLEIEFCDPARCNALTPQLLEDFDEHLGGPSFKAAHFVLLTAQGNHFSTGGDVRRFYEAATKGQAGAYARQLVNALHAIIETLLSCDKLVVTAAQGAITGGSVGFLMASDLVVLQTGSFIQPYYREVGFGPDGGWTAILPELVGAKRALSLQYRNQRLTADQALQFGLADKMVDEDPANAARALIDQLNQADPDALIVAKKLVWDDARLKQVKRGLEAETEAFCSRIELAPTKALMADFLKIAEDQHV